MHVPCTAELACLYASVTHIVEIPPLGNLSRVGLSMLARMLSAGHAITLDTTCSGVVTRQADCRCQIRDDVTLSSWRGEPSAVTAGSGELFAIETDSVHSDQAGAMKLEVQALRCTSPTQPATMFLQPTHTQPANQ